MFQDPVSGSPETLKALLSISDLDMSRSSIFPMGKMGGGRKSTPPGPTIFLPARHSDEFELPDQFPLLTTHNSQTHFAKRHRDFFSRCSMVPD